MTLEYAQPTYISNGCKCRAHSQHRLFRWLWYNPGGTLKAAAQELHTSYPAVLMAHWRLKGRTDLPIRCPECFETGLRRLTCQSCGAELDNPSVPIQGYFDSLNPVHVIQPLGGLGSHTDYQRLRPEYGHRNVKHLAERVENPLLERAKSELWQELKEVMPPDGVVEEATLLLARSVHDFAIRYPDLCRAKALSHQLVENVLGLLRLRYPQLRKDNDITRDLPVLSGEKT